MRFSAHIEDKIARYREQTLAQSTFGQFSSVAGRRVSLWMRTAPRSSAKPYIWAIVTMALAVLALASIEANAPQAIYYIGGDR